MASGGLEIASEFAAMRGEKQNARQSDGSDEAGDLSGDESADERVCISKNEGE